MGLADPLDSATACGFKVRIDGIEIPKVMEVSGLKMEVDKQHFFCCPLWRAYGIKCVAHRKRQA